MNTEPNNVIAHLLVWEGAIRQRKAAREAVVAAYNALPASGLSPKEREGFLLEIKRAEAKASRAEAEVDRLEALLLEVAGAVRAEVGL